MNADDFAELSNLSLSMPDGGSSAQHRTKFRIMSEGVSVRLTWPELSDKGLDSFEVNDISVGGLYMRAPEGIFTRGQSIMLDVLVLGRCCVGGLKARVVRSSKDGCAVAFEDLSRNQELRLDKIVLEMQKRAIGQRKKEQMEKEARYAREAVASSEYDPSDISLKIKL